MASRSQDATSTQSDALPKGFVTHRGVLSFKIVAGLRAQIHQAANRVLDRREVAARDAADHVHAGRAALDLHVGVAGGRSVGRAEASGRWKGGASGGAPLAAISGATVSASAPSRATSMTAAPAAASARAAPSPRPRLAPVTRATFPFKSLDTGPPASDRIAAGVISPVLYVATKGNDHHPHRPFPPPVHHPLHFLSPPP